MLLLLLLLLFSPTLANIIIQTSSKFILSGNKNIELTLPRDSIIFLFKGTNFDSTFKIPRLFILWQRLGIRYKDLDKDTRSNIIRTATIAIIISPKDTPIVLQTLSSFLVKWGDIPNRQRNSLSIAIGLALKSIINNSEDNDNDKAVDNNYYDITNTVAKRLIAIKGKWSLFTVELR